MNQIDISHENNFDLIRLFAAFQVLLLHHLAFFEFDNDQVVKIIEKLIWNFPGVNIFFIISGYLIFQSLERNHPISFVKKRFKRIFPALTVCFILTVALLLHFGSLNARDIFSLDFVKWAFAQLTIFQFYNPDMVRDFGFSPPNGALWTISVELQYYLFIAALWYLCLRKLSRKKQNMVLMFFFIISAIFNYAFHLFLKADSLLYKLSFAFFLSYLYFFIAGAFVYINRVFFIPKFKDRAVYWLLLFIIVGVLLNFLQIKYSRYAFNWLSFGMLLLLTGLTFSLAFTRTRISKSILKGNDFSYGIYIYQMPILNVFFHLHFNTSFLQLLCSMGFCFLMGIISWFTIEKKILNR